MHPLHPLLLPLSVQSLQMCTPLIKACDISSSTDSSEDSIHCLKPSEVAHSALETITEMTTRFNSERLDEEDPFAECDSEMEDDEALINDE